MQLQHMPRRARPSQQRRRLHLDLRPGRSVKRVARRGELTAALGGDGAFALALAALLDGIERPRRVELAARPRAV
jgi:hypothetical protein